ncbi:amidohydrolase family protein [Sulfitobacter sp. D35]|uniref:metal-dependent hydrolase family protein n=1 Tax=Sulfitobacter sp. D35 TaxID=3083252 RepID=UPI00296F273F|nr:amidohydrolase family protein [Sulfitobacter sp. D35]MDW4496414.1 amidohydrolase family protein [Sulfitobacter sp. D35]
MLRAFPMASALAFSAAVAWAQNDPSGPIIITNVNVFDGLNAELIEDANVVIDGNLFAQITTEDLAVAGGQVIDGGGRTMIPGLTDSHWHMSLAELPQTAALFGDAFEVGARTVIAAERTLMRGFTTVRDLGGNAFSVAKMIDNGEVPGPRRLVSGPPLSQTGGHYDYRLPFEVPAPAGETQDYWGRTGLVVIADGVPLVQQRAREVFRMGAAQLKMAVGGGVASVFDPLDVRQYSLDEMKAAVDVAESYNSYLAVHVFTDDAVQMAIEAGVKSIDHGFLIGRETLELMKEEGVWLSIQPLLDDEDRMTFPNPASTRKWVQVTSATETIYPMAKEIGVKIAFGTDALFDQETTNRQGKLLSKLEGLGFTPFEALKMATSDNAELFALAGPRHPYQDGPLGQLTEGAYADLILVDGNPLDDLGLVADPWENFDLIMKDGIIFKNEL